MTSLSDKIESCGCGFEDCHFTNILAKDVKSAVKELKDWVYKMDVEEGYFCGEEGESMRNKIDEIFGDKLV